MSTPENDTNEALADERVSAEAAAEVDVEAADEGTEAAEIVGDDGAEDAPADEIVEARRPPREAEAADEADARRRGCDGRRARGPRCGTQGRTASRTRRLVRHPLLRRLREQGEGQPRDPCPEPRRRRLHLPGRSAHRRGHRDQERPAQAGQPQGAARLHPGPHGSQRRVLGRGAQHARRHRIRRRDLAPVPADHRRGRQVPAPGSEQKKQAAAAAARRRGRAAKPPPSRSSRSTSRSASRSPSWTARSRRCPPASARSTPSSRSSRCWSRSSVARPRSSCRFTQVAKI